MAQVGDWVRRSQTWPSLGGFRWAETVSDPASPVEELRDDGTRAVRTFLCRWEDRIFFGRRLVGYPEIQAVGGVQYISRKLPESHPDYRDIETGRPYLFCTEIQRIDPVGTPEPDAVGAPIRMRRPGIDIADYFLAKLTCTYTTLPYDVFSDAEMHSAAGFPDESTLRRFVTIMPRPAGQALPLPQQMFKYVWTNKDTVPGFPSTIVPEHDWQITWHRVPTAAVGTKMVNPDAASYPIDELLGKVNATDFPTDATSIWPAGTLLLTGAGLRPYRSPAGPRLWDITYFIKAFNPGLTRTPVDVELGGPSEIGHNHLIMPPTLSGTGKVEYAEVTTDGATNLVMQVPGKTIHDYGEFARLFRVPS